MIDSNEESVVKKYEEQSLKLAELSLQAIDL